MSTSAAAWLGVDVGTGTLKVGVYGPEGHLLAAHQEPQATSSPAPGAMLQEPERDWWWGTVRAIRAVSATVDLRTIGGIGVCGHFPSVCLVDGQGRPVGHASLYGDTRAWRESEEVGKATGLNLRGDEVAPRLRWLSRHHPGVLAAARLALGPGGFLVHRLTGVASIDPHSAARWGFPVNQARDGWDTGAIRLLDIDPDLLPPVRGFCEIVGAVTPGAASTTGLAEGTPVVAGATDTLAAFLGHRAVDAGETLVHYGSSGFIAVLSRSLDDVLGDSCRIPAREPYQLSRFAPGSGLFVQGLRSMLGRAYQHLDPLAAEISPGAEGVFVVLPADEGPTAVPGSLVGVTLAHHAGHIWRAGLESLGYPLMGFRAPAAHVVASGNGARSPVWRQIISDMTGLRQRFDPPGSGTLGAALLAAMGTGGLSSVRQGVQLACWADPVWTDGQADREAQYRGLLAAWTSLREALAQVPHEAERLVSRRTLQP